VFYGKKEEVDMEGGKRRHDSLAMTTLTNFPGRFERDGASGS